MDGGAQCVSQIPGEDLFQAVELLLQSRRVVPGRLLGAGFAFEHPTWQTAARDLVAKRRTSATS